MACAVACAATDVGDAAAILGETGKVVPPSQPDALCTAWRSLLAAGPEGRARFGDAARLRIERHFSLPVIVAQYEHLYERVLAGA
jgi:glycosyltransferase involved in cell wall biosynthesis